MLVIIIGIKRSADKPPVVENLYTGLDADAGHEIAEEAADGGEYSSITRYTNPSGSALRVRPHHPEFLKKQKEEADKRKKAAEDQKNAKATVAEKAREAKEAKEKLAKENQIKADALKKQKADENQARADEFIAGGKKAKAAKPTKAAEEGAPDAEQ